MMFDSNLYHWRDLSFSYPNISKNFVIDHVIVEKRAPKDTTPQPGVPVFWSMIYMQIKIVGVITWVWLTVYEWNLLYL